MKSTTIGLFLAAGALGGCSLPPPAPPVIVELRTDKAVVQAVADTSIEAIQMLAKEACGIHGRVAHGPLSRTCIEMQYCPPPPQQYPCYLRNRSLCPPQPTPKPCLMVCSGTWNYLFACRGG